MFPILKTLKRALRVRGIKLVDLAREINISYTSLNSWTNGYAKMSQEIQNAISQSLDVKREELFPEYQQSPAHHSTIPNIQKTRESWNSSNQV